MIRAFTAADAEAVSALVRALNAEEGYDPKASPDGAALCAAFLPPDACGTLLVAERDGAVVGYVTLHPTYATTKAERGAHLGDLYVVPAARRGGLGRALMAAAAAETRRAGGRHLWWTALPQNAGGQAFYAAIGAESETLVVHDVTGEAFARLSAGPPP